MLPLASEAVLDAVIEELFQAATNAPAALQHELADACHHLAEVDRQECFVAIVFKGWYYVSVGGRVLVLPVTLAFQRDLQDVSGSGERWDGPHAGAVAAKAAAQSYVSFGRRLVARCKAACELALRERASDPGVISVSLFSFAAVLSNTGMLPRLFIRGLAVQLVQFGDGDAATHAERSVDAFCALVVRGGCRTLLFHSLMSRSRAGTASISFQPPPWSG